jgi:2'-5' RNA ligase
MPASLRGEEQMTSIWLRPQDDQEQALQSLIDRIAGEHGTVPFAPHLTVCGVPDLAVLDAAAAYVKRCGLLPLRVAKIAVTGAVITPFRAVFIEVENSPELREFRERLRASPARRRSFHRISASSICSTGSAKGRGPISTPRG